eukprot:g7329.t1
MSDAVFANTLEFMGELRFFIIQRIKRFAFIADKAILQTRLRPSLIVFLTVLATLFLLWFLQLLRILLRINYKSHFLTLVRSMPMTRHLIKKETQKLKNHLENNKRQFLGDEKAILTLPEQGWSTHHILTHLTERVKRDVVIHQTDSTVSGTVYIANTELETLLCSVYKLHCLTNPLHPNVFPSVRQMEAEVITICGKLLNSKGVAKNVCGAMTGGGTESILSAVKASRDYMRHEKNITEPEMIICQSAHPAYYKAAEYFGIKLKVLKVDREYKFPVNKLRKTVGLNTILMVASAPGYPHGVIDPVQQMAQIAQENGVLLHVDCCLGGLFLPFVSSLGYEVPVFDFSIKGVTSISVDTHKYGMSHKGTSVVLYRSQYLRKYQYTSVSDWSGGLYVSPGLNGSRSGALIATAWASLVYLGRNGLEKTTNQIMKTIDEFKSDLGTIPDLEIVGNPIGPVVAFKLKKQPGRIYKVNDLISEKGWHLSPLQFPPALHMAFTGRHTNTGKKLIKDLKECVDMVKRDSTVSKEGTAGIYGTACSVPDRRIVRDLLDTYQDCLLSP